LAPLNEALHTKKKKLKMKITVHCEGGVVAKWLSSSTTTWDSWPLSLSLLSSLLNPSYACSLLKRMNCHNNGFF
jgi:hypothetical protein